MRQTTPPGGINAMRAAFEGGVKKNKRKRKGKPKQGKQKNRLFVFFEDKCGLAS